MKSSPNSEKADPHLIIPWLLRRCWCYEIGNSASRSPDGCGILRGKSTCVQFINRKQYMNAKELVVRITNGRQTLRVLYFHLSHFACSQAKAERALIRLPHTWEITNGSITGLPVTSLSVSLNDANRVFSKRIMTLMCLHILHTQINFRKLIKLVYQQ